MGKVKHFIILSDEERSVLEKVIREGKESARTLMRARILLMSDMKETKRLSINKLAETLGTTQTTIQTTRTEYATGGLATALYRKKKVKTKATDDVIQKIVALSKEPPPKGKKSWSFVTLSEESQRRGIVPCISDVTVMQILHEYNPDYKKRNQIL